jgi:hypothetical protein
MGLRGERVAQAIVSDRGMHNGAALRAGMHLAPEHWHQTPNLEGSAVWAAHDQSDAYTYCTWFQTHLSSINPVANQSVSMQTLLDEVHQLHTLLEKVDCLHGLKCCVSCQLQ